MSGRDHLLRASTYYRAAEYYGEATGTDGAPANSQACFLAAAALVDPPVEALSIPFEGGALPGYLVRPPAASAGAGPRPTVVAVGGFNSSAEELYFQLGVPGAERGLNVVVFDGPGQLGCMLTSPNLTFRPDD